jgi:outer membrane protein assembly factor BamB
MTWTPAVDSSGCTYIQGNYNDAYYGFHKLSPEVGWRGLTASSPVIIMLSSHPKGVILWSTQAHKRMPDDDPDHITPPVFNHDETTVYFASCSYDTVFTQSYTVFAINTATGAHRWSFTPFDLACTAGGEAQIAVGPNGHVYFGAGIDVLIAFSPTGLELWYVDIGDPYDARITSGPVVSHIDGTIYVALDLVGERDLGAIQAYHVDGTLKWMYNTTERGGYVPWAPTIDQRGNVYFSFDDTVYKLDPTGLLVWNYTAPVGPAPDGYFWAGGMIDCECAPPFAVTRCLVACQWH